VLLADIGEGPFEMPMTITVSDGEQALLLTVGPGGKRKLH